MRRYRIEAFDSPFFVYCTKAELPRFSADYKCDPPDAQGLSNGNGIWILGEGDWVKVCYHEACHLVDWLLEDRLAIPPLPLSATKELRAYLVDYVGSRVERYVREKTRAADGVDDGRA